MVDSWKFRMIYILLSALNGDYMPKPADETKFIVVCASFNCIINLVDKMQAVVSDGGAMWYTGAIAPPGFCFERFRWVNCPFSLNIFIFRVHVPAAFV